MAMASWILLHQQVLACSTLRKVYVLAPLHVTLLPRATKKRLHVLALPVPTAQSAASAMITTHGKIQCAEVAQDLEVFQAGAKGIHSKDFEFLIQPYSV